jgi:hypothetical protein
MRYATEASSALLLLAYSALGLGQNASSSAKPEPPSVGLPKGDNAWVVRVVRSGGLNADTFQDITIRSTGQLTIDLVSITRNALNRLHSSSIAC